MRNAKKRLDETIRLVQYLEKCWASVPIAPM